MGLWIAVLPSLVAANLIDDFYCMVAGCYSGECAKLCTQCSGPMALECETCSANAVMTSEGCKCTPGFYPFGPTCSPCHSSCATCYGGESTQCDSCRSGLTLIGHSCECPSGHFLGPAGDCPQCHETCKECYGPSKYQCVTCWQRAALHLSRCNCQSGFYPNPHAGNCTECHPSCYSCFGPEINQCKECRSHALLSQGMCMCKEGYYHRNEIDCLSCDGTCRSCSGPTAQQCLTCRTGAINWSGQCSCAQGYYPQPDSSSCRPCLSTCRAGVACFHPSQKLTKRTEFPTPTQMTVARVLCDLENQHSHIVSTLSDAFIVDAFEFNHLHGDAVVALLHLRTKSVRGKGLELIHEGLDKAFNHTVVVFTQPRKYESRPSGDDYSPGKSASTPDNWHMVEDLVYPFYIQRKLVTTQEDGTTVQVVELCAEARGLMEPKRRLLEALYFSLTGKNLSIQYS